MIKIYSFLLVMLCLVASVIAQDSDSLFAQIKFDKKLHDFGEVKEGTTVEQVFFFSNIGNDTLRIQNVHGG